MRFCWGIDRGVAVVRSGVVALGCLVVILASTPARAQDWPLPPVDSEVAVCIVPSKFVGNHLPLEVWQEQPLARLFSRVLTKFLGFGLVEELSQVWEGTVVGAILPVQGKGSSLTAYFEDRDLHSRRSDIVSSMGALNEFIVDSKRDGESYPENLSAFLEENSYPEPQLPAGVSYSYSREKSGQGYRLKVLLGPKSELRKLGPAPVWGDDNFRQNILPAVERFTPHYGLGIKLLDPNKGKDLLVKLFGEPTDGFWQQHYFPTLTATVRGQWLVVADSKERIGSFYKAVTGHSLDLGQSPGFKKVARHLDLAASALVYIDLPKQLKAVAADAPAEFAHLVNMLGPAGWSLSLLDENQTHNKFFLGLNPPKDSELAELLARSAKPSSSTFPDASIVPWDVASVGFMEYGKARQILRAVLGLIPDLKEQWLTLEGFAASYLGLDAEAGFDKLFNGWVVISYDSLGFWTNSIEDFLSFFNSPARVTSTEVTEDIAPSGEVEASDSQLSEDSTIDTNSGDDGSELEPKGEVDAAGDPSTLDPFKPQEEGEEDSELVEPDDRERPLDWWRILRRVPVTFALRPTNAEAKAAIVSIVSRAKLFEPKTDEDGASLSSNEGWLDGSSASGDLALAESGEWIYVSCGQTTRILRNFLLTASGEKESLLSIASWRKFCSDYGNRASLLAHQKVDVSATFAKALLLYMGPEFRTIANQVGKLRDSYHALVLVPEGIVMVNDIVYGDGR